MKILITGAHFTPAVAVIEELKKNPDIKIVYVGRDKTMEGDKSKSQESLLIPTLGVKFIPIITGRLQRSLTIYTLLSLLKLPIGFVQSVYIILKEKPNVILSFGGYISVPIVVAGWLFSIPIIIHEQTLVSGLASTISSFFADRIAISFNIDRDTNSKIIVTGNPIRKDLINPNKKFDFEFEKIFSISAKQKLPIIFIMGGNQGSHVLNIACEPIISDLTKLACVIHVTGDNKFNDFKRLSELGSFDNRYIVKKWIGENYGAILRKAKLVISRAGINTMLELAYLEKPALVIPIPYVYKNEQYKNALFFRDYGLVEILPQNKLSSESLLKNIKLMIENLVNLTLKAKGVKKSVIENAAQRLALETLMLVKE